MIAGHLITAWSVLRVPEITTLASSEKPSAVVRRWKQWVEPWYVAYALLGAAAAGLVPILLPLAVSRAGGASDAGLAVAAFSLGGLTAPVWSALGVRLLAFLGLLGLGLIHTGAAAWLALPKGGFALLAFLFVVLAWSLLSVGGTALTARLSPVGEGEGIGIFNAVTALAGVVGAALGGWVAGQWGYNAVSGLAAGGVGLGLLLLVIELNRGGTVYGANDSSRPNGA